MRLSDYKIYQILSLKSLVSVLVHVLDVLREEVNQDRVETISLMQGRRSYCKNVAITLC